MSVRIFYELLNSSNPSASDLREQQRQSILEAVKKIESAQPLYHPIYGFESELPSSYRLDLLERDCEHVRKHFAQVKDKTQVRILDVGCNNGYVTLKLSETFSNVIGLEVLPENRNLAEMLAVYSGSKARFSSTDIFEVIRSGADDLETIDAVCLFNVLHQIIFAYGLNVAKRLVAKLVASVDVVFAELANKDDYKAHNKDYLLPWAADEIFSECLSTEIELLETNPRPLYKLRRKIARFGSISIEPTSIKFSDNPHVSRKYYLSDRSFLKIHRFSEEVNARFFHAEVNALLKMSGDHSSPDIFDWTLFNNCGAVLMSSARGVPLLDCLYRYESASSRESLIGDIIKLSLGSYNRVGFHNDLSPHNIIVNENGSLILIDFEQSMPIALVDPFANLLWTIHDILSADPISYKKKIHDELRVGVGNVKTKPSLYPNINSSGVIEELIADAVASTDWPAFLNRWASKI